MDARRLACIPMIVLLLALCACGGGKSEDELALEMRLYYLEIESCAGTMALTADYGARIYEYTLGFNWTQDGETVLTIEAPEELAGMTARAAAGETYLLFDEVQLETGPLSADGLSPMDALPAILNYIFTGYIAECGTEILDDVACLRVQYRAPEADRGSGLEAALWFDKTDYALRRAELQNDGFTVICADITDWSVTAAETADEAA